MRKLSLRDLEMGEPLAWDVFDDSGVLLLRKGYVVESERQMHGLVDRGLFIIADGGNAAPAAPAAAVEARFDPFWLWDNILSKLVRVLRDIETQELVEDKLAGTALLVCMLTDKNPDAALGAILLKDTERYAYVHALHVAVLAAIISRRLGWGDGERRDLVCAALSMNAAMTALQTALAEQSTPLSEVQRRAVESHPRRGRELLQRMGIDNPRWLQAVELHHRKQNLAAGALDRADAATMAELLRTLDVFCAKISPRAYRRALLPPVAARELFVRERDLDSPFLAPLIKEVGLYMPGTFIKLGNGDLALVVRRGASVDAPRVVALARGDGSPYLDVIRRDTARPEFVVAGAIPKERIRHHLNLARIWGYSA